MSQVQKDILIYLLNVTEHYQQHGNDFQKSIATTQGVPWQPKRIYAGYQLTRSEQAAISRSLKRLEARGLVMRNNFVHGIGETGRVRLSLDQPPPKRTDHVLLTDKGREVAKRLTKTEE